MNTRPSTLRHIPALDGLRGIAVVGVLLFHGDHLRGGFLGVDLFFTLSGFLITTILLQEVLRSDTVRLGHFWARRARRLLPALLALVIAVALYAVVWARPDELNSIRGDAFATLGYVANWRTIIDGHSYWDLFAAPSPFRHTWSLAIEEQFYLFWPLIVLLVAKCVHAERRRAPALLAVCGVLGAASLVEMALLFHPDRDPQRVYLGSDTRVGSILLGAALASLLIWRGPLSGRAARWTLEAAAGAALAVLAWAWITVDGGDTLLYRGGFALFATCAAAIIASIVHPRTGPVAQLLSFAPLRWFGLISYGLYLWHWPVYLVLTPARTGIDGWELLGVRVVVSTAIAVASYFCVEMPVRRGVWSGWRIRAATPAVALLAVLAIVVTTTGAVERTSANASARPAKAPLAASAPAGSTRVLVAGDSVAWHLGHSFERLAPELGLTSANVAFDGCSLEKGATAARYFGGKGDVQLEGHDCTVGWSDAVARFQPQIVVLVLAGQVLGDWQVDGEWTRICERRYDDWYGAQMRDGVDLLTAQGARVVLVAPPPSTLSFVPPELNQGNECIHAIEQNIAEANPMVTSLDLAPLVCPAGKCRSEIDGVTLRPDGIHFEGAGADIVTRWLAPKLRQIAQQPPT